MTPPLATIARDPDRIASAEFDLPALLADIKARRSEFITGQRIPADIIEGFKRLGVYRAMVAKRFGGEERTPAEFCRLIETISEADGSAGWVASFGSAACYLAALPEETLRKVYAKGPDVVFAGGLFPLQT
jgi:alkylation response protein AidB-like acyl-CoA dehydrogenase